MAVIEVGPPAKTLALAALWLSAEASAGPASTGASYDCSNASGAFEQQRAPKACLSGHKGRKCHATA